MPVAELDPFGELAAAAQVRLLQLAAARASADAGFDASWYENHASTWVVRFTRLRRLAEARHSDELAVRTWVSDFRRVRSLRQYEITRIADGATVARGATDWVYVDTAAGAPAAVPREIQSAFMPAGLAVQKRPRRLRMPRDLEAPASVLRRVELADLDSLGHVNNSRYVSFVEEAVYERLGAEGWTPSFASRAPHPRLVEIHIEYFNEALFGHTLAARVHWAAASEASLDATVEILAGGAQAVVATTRWQWSDGPLPDALRRRA